MAGDALPRAKLLHPRVGEASDVVIGLALVRALGVIDTGDDRGVAKEVHLDVLDIESGGFEMRVSDLGQKFLFVGEFAVPLSIYKPARNQSFQGSRIPVHLSLIPQALQNHQVVLAWI